MHECRRARICGCDQCAPQRLFQLESRRAEPACIRIHCHRNIPERRRATRGFGDSGEPLRERMRCDHCSGLPICSPLRRCGKGHADGVLLDRKTCRTSVVPNQCQRTPGSHANRRQRMRDYWRQHSVCRGGARSTDNSPTRANAFRISDAASEMTRHGIQCSKSTVEHAAIASSPV